MRVLALTAALFCAVLMTGTAFAQDPMNGRQLIIDLSDDHVGITTGFNGADISLFGIKSGPGDIAIVIRGPDRTAIVRQKSQVGGLWVNGDSAAFTNVPSYYDYAVSRGDLAKVDGLGLGSLRFANLGNEDTETLERFRESLIRNMQTSGHYPLRPRSVIFLANNFFRVNFHVPSDVPTGNYIVKTYLLKDGGIVATSENLLRVEQTGMSAGINRFAHRMSLLYSVMAITLSLIAGVSGHFLFRRD